MRELIVAVNVRAVFLHGGLYFQDSRIFARLGIEHADDNELTPSDISLSKICRELNASADEILELK